MKRLLNIAIDIDDMLTNTAEYSQPYRDVQMPYPRIANWKEAVEIVVRLERRRTEER